MWPLMTHSSPSRTARVSQQRRDRSRRCRARSSRTRSAGRRRAAGAGSAPSGPACRPARGSRSCPSPAPGCRTPRARTGDVPRISCISPSLTCPKPWPPSSGGRCAAHSPRSLTRSCSGAIARPKPSSPSSSKTVSIGQTSSRTKSRIQSSCSWNSGSVEKSHAMPSIIARLARIASPVKPRRPLSRCGHRDLSRRARSARRLRRARFHGRRHRRWLYEIWPATPAHAGRRRAAVVDRRAAARASSTSPPRPRGRRESSRDVRGGRRSDGRRSRLVRAAAPSRC